jgi:hypothetical protein
MLYISLAKINKQTGSTYTALALIMLSLSISKERSIE